jgi:hypothetical protein
MSQEGLLTFFSKREIPSPASVIASVMRDIIGADRTWITTRTRFEDQSWARWRRMVDSDFSLREKEQEEEWLPKGLTPEQAGQAFRPGTRLMLIYTGTPLGLQLDRVLQRIDEKVRGQFIPGAPTLTVGWHDIWETAENDDGTLFGRAFISLSLRGNTSPNDWPEYRRQVFQVPEVIELQQRLEQILGPVERCIYWSV